MEVGAAGELVGAVLVPTAAAARTAYTIKRARVAAEFRSDRGDRLADQRPAAVSAVRAGYAIREGQIA